MRVTVDVAAGAATDLGLVDALARLHLAAQRLGGQLLIRSDGPHLAELVAAAGLADVLSVECRGQPEPREQRRVEKVVDVRDPSA